MGIILLIANLMESLKILIVSEILSVNIFDQSKFAKWDERESISVFAKFNLAIFFASGQLQLILKYNVLWSLGLLGGPNGSKTEKLETKLSTLQKSKSNILLQRLGDLINWVKELGIIAWLNEE